MKISTITQKGQATIPLEVRKKLDLHAGDKIVFDMVEGNVVMRKLRPFDIQYHSALSKTLADEWNSKEDDEAYDDL